MEERVLEQSRDGTEGTMVSQDFRRQLEGYGLTTANIPIGGRIILGSYRPTSGRITTSARCSRT